jgi:hypothetical protein
MKHLYHSKLLNDERVLNTCKVIDPRSTNRCTPIISNEISHEISQSPLFLVKPSVCAS